MKTTIIILIIALFSINATAQNKKQGFNTAELKIDSVTNLVTKISYDKDSITVPTDTLQLTTKSKVKAVKIGKEIFVLKKKLPGAIAIELNEQGIAEIYDLIDQSAASHQRVEVMKKIIADQYNAQTKKPDPVKK